MYVYMYINYNIVLYIFLANNMLDCTKYCRGHIALFLVNIFKHIHALFMYIFTY